MIVTNSPKDTDSCDLSPNLDLKSDLSPYFRGLDEALNVDLDL